MCGIAGMLGACDETAVRTMTQMLWHRGPDDGAVWTGTDAGFGHRRLKIIDLTDAARQPMCSEDGRAVLVFNGEIFNYRELRATLATRGHRFRTTSDSEVLLHACMEWGEDVVRHLTGQFAFAFHDTAQRATLLVRDHLGVKPLYYAERDGTLYFASEAKAIAAVLPASRVPRLDMLAPFVAFLWIPGNETFFSGIHRLPPGTRAWWRDGRLRVETWWDPVARWEELAHDSDGADTRTASQRGEELRELLGEVVRDQLVSDAPLGLLLSGGVDSTILLAEMAALAHTPRAFTATYGAISRARDVFDDDLPFARAAARHFAAALTVETLEDDLPTLLPAAVWHCDEPLADPTIVTNLALTRRAGQSLTVLLTGMGADEIFAGYPRYPATMLGESLRAVPALFPRMAHGLLGAALRGGLVPIARARRPLQLLTHLHKPFSERYLGYSSYASTAELHSLLAGDLRDTATDHTMFAWHRDVLRRTENLSPLARLLATDLVTFLPRLNLENTDKTGMANGVELRVPFLDHRLVEFAMRLPDADKLGRGDVRKVLLRAAWTGRVPEDILHRAKTGYSPPVRGWIRETHRAYIRDILLSDRAAQRGVFTRSAIETLFEENDRGRADHALRLWSLLVFETWMREYVDRRDWRPAHDPAALPRVPSGRIPV
ncbi:MAG: asparagine synthase (glutamine-hydrolyzing) [Bacteroidota bacterium]|jgi:asparagine synthase (glutamine-hydrolysing)|nr:asparagine synthase (glutamine-hydrolyzing) [Bacteroidota bacterium]